MAEHHALGGPIPADNVVTIGERGPEVLDSYVGGFVYPNDRIALDEDPSADS